MFASLYRISKEHWNPWVKHITNILYNLNRMLFFCDNDGNDDLFLVFRAIVALVYNVLKAFMEMNSTLFDELTSTYKSDRQRWDSRTCKNLMPDHDDSVCIHTESFRICFDFFSHPQGEEEGEGERGVVEEAGGSGVEEKPPERRNYSHLTTRLLRNASPTPPPHARNVGLYFPFCICATYFTVDSPRQSHYFKSTVNNFYFIFFIPPVKILCRNKNVTRKQS